MSSIDNRIVNMEFNNEEFERRIRDTIASMSALEKGLDISGAGNSIMSIGDNVASITERFSSLGVVGMTVLQELTRSAIDLGSKITSSLLGPITSGGKQRALNIEQAMFQFKGLGMDVEATMADADYAVAGTAYGLDSAAKVASQLGASGMRAGEEMRTSLRAISGVAAMAGSSYEDVGNVFTRVAGQGRVMGQDLLSLSSRGINAAATIAKHFNMTEAEVRSMVTAGQISFGMFSEAMDSAFGEHATAANETFSGSMSNVRSALARIGAKFYTPFHNNMIGPLNAFRVAVNNVNEAIDPLFKALSGWMDKVSPKVVEFIEGWDFSGLTKAIPYVVKIISNLSSIFSRIGQQIGRVFDAIGAAWSNVFPPVSIKAISNIVENFKDLFYSTEITADSLMGIRRIFEGVFSVLKVLGGALGVVASGIWGVVKPLGSMIEPLLEVLGYMGRVAYEMSNAIFASKGLGEVLDILKSSLDRLGVVGEWIGGIFDWLSDKIQGALESIGISTEKYKQQLTPVNVVTNAVTTAFGLLEAGLRAIDPILRGIGDVVSDVFGTIKEWMSSIISGDSQFGKVTFGVGAIAILGHVVKEAALHLRWLGQAMKDGFGLLGFGETKTRIDQVLGNLTGALRHMQDNIIAGTLVKIATGVLMLATAVTLLSVIDADKLAKGLAAVTLLFTEMMMAMTALSKTQGTSGALKLAGMQSAVIALSISMLIMASAAKKLSELNWEQVAVGVVGVASMMAVMVGAVRALTVEKGASTKFAAGALMLIGIATAVRILATAVEQLGDLDPEQLGKGLISVGIVLAELAVFSRLAKTGGMNVSTAAGIAVMAGAVLIFGKAIEMLGDMKVEILEQGIKALAMVLGQLALFTKLVGGEKKMLSIGLGLAILSGSLLIFNKSIAELGAMDLEVLKQGLAGFGAVLGILAIALNLMPKNLPITAAGLVLLSGAIVVLSGAVMMLGSMTAKDLLLGIAGLAASLGVLALTADLMKGSLGGAAAMVVMAGAVALLVPPILALGSVPITTLGKGLLALAGAFVVLGGAGIVLAPFAPALLAVSAALLVAGVGIAAIGVGVMALAAGFVSLAGSGLAAGVVIQTAILGMIAMLPMLFKAMAEGFVSMIVTIGQSISDIVTMFKELALNVLSTIIELVPQIVTVLVTIIDGLLTVIIESAPKFMEALTILINGFLQLVIDIIPQVGELFSTLIQTIIDVVVENTPLVIQAGWDLIIGFLESIRDNIGEVVNIATDIIINFLTTIQERFPDLIQSGLETILAFINGLANAVRDNYEDVAEAALNLIGAFIEAVVGTFKLLLEKGGEVFKNIFKGIKDAIFGGKKDTNTQGNTIVQDVLKGIKDKLVDAFKSGVDFIAEILAGVIKGVADVGSKLLTAGVDIVKGVIGGITSWFSNLFSGGKEAAEEAAAGAKKGANDAGSGLKTAGQGIGKNLIEGAKSGISSMAESVKRTATNVFSGVLGGVKSFLGIHSPSTEFSDVAYWSLTGFIRRMAGMGKDLWNAGKEAGKSALTSMSDALSGIDDILEDDPNLSPVITPILNLDGVQSQWGKFAYAGLGANVSSNAAQSVASRSNDIFNSTGGKDSGVTNNEVKVSFDGAVFHVREEADIHKISAELATIIERKSRG